MKEVWDVIISQANGLFADINTANTTCTHPIPRGSRGFLTTLHTRSPPHPLTRSPSHPHPLHCDLSRTLVLAAIIAQWLCAPRPAAAADAALPTSLLKNPAFQDKNGSGVPGGWELHPGGNGKTTFLSLAKEDEGSVVHIVDNDPENGVGLRQMVPGSPGHAYSFSVETRGSSLFLYLNFRDAQNHLLGLERRAPTLKTDAWRERTLRVNSPAGTAVVEAWIYSASDTIADVLVRHPMLRDEGPAVEQRGPVTSAMISLAE